MTISSTVRTAGPYTGTGSVNTYPFAFKVFQAGDMLAQQTDASGNITTLALTTNYSVTLNADQNANPGGSIVLNSNLPSGYKLILSSQVPELQGTSITNNGGFYPQVVENAFDYLTVLVQQLQTQLAQCTQLPLAVQGVSTTLPVPIGGSLLGWNVAGTALVNVGASGVGAGSITDVNVSSTAAIQASKLSFLQSGTGSVNRTVQAKLSERVSAKDFGAVGNGIADDTAALQAAINYCVSNGYTLHIPAGTYLVTASLTNTLQSGGLVISGDGRNQSTIKVTGSTAFVTLSLGSATYTSNEVLIQNVGFVNTQTITGYGWAAIYAQNVGHLAIRNSLISGGSRGIDVYAGYACDISDNLISGCYAEGIYLESAAGNGSRIVGNGVFSCGTGGAAGAVTAISADNVLVSSNDIEGGYGGVFLSACEGGRIASNFIEGQSNYNIYFASSTTGVAVRDNWLGVPGETIENCSNLQIKGNTFYNHNLVVNSATASGIDLCYNTVLGTSSIPKNYYITPTFSNGWVADTTGFGGFLMPPGYRKDSNNIVRIRGAIKSGTAVLAFTLPAGYRPKANLVFCCSGYGLASPSATQVTVELNGNVSIAGIPANTSLDGIIFEAEA